MRKQAARGAVASVLILLAGCSPPAPTPPPEAPAAPGAATPSTVVRVYNWEEYIDPEVLAEFTAETGLQVDYQTFPGNEDLQALINAGEPFADVVFPTAIPFGREQVQARQLRRLPDSVRNRSAELDPNIARALRRADSTGSYLVPYLWGTTGIGYNVDKVRAALGPDTDIETWKMVFDPAYTARLAGCGIGIQAERTEIIAAAMIYYDPSQTDASLTEFILERSLAKTIEHVKFFGGSTRIIDELASGEICVALAWSGDVQQAVDRAEEEDNGQRVAYMIPKEGGLVWMDVMAMPANAPNPDGGARFIEYLLRPTVQAKISNFVAYASAVPAAEPLLDEAIRSNPTIYPSDQVRQRLYSIPGVSERNRQTRDEAFDAVVMPSGKWHPDDE
ncbi:MAG: extracellular solute-binding protein [Xanthomonadales bacterium]|nr:extracellular solute-binding protein [Xanthomonadales bacterium]